MKIQSAVKCQLPYTETTHNSYAACGRKHNTNTAQKHKAQWHLTTFGQKRKLWIYVKVLVGCAITIWRRGGSRSTRRKPLTTCSENASCQSQNFFSLLWFEPLHYRRHTHYRQRRRTR
jgi:hypothetical protein